MSSRFDFLIRTSIEGDGEAIRRLGRVEQALGQAARNAAAGSVNKTALSQAQNKAAAALEKARANVMGSAAVQGMGFNPVGGASYTPSKWRSYQPFGGRGGGGSWGPAGGGAGGGPPILAGGNTWGGALGRGLSESGVGGRLQKAMFGGGIPIHVKGYLAALLAARVGTGVANLAKSAGQMSAVKGTFDELSGGAAAGELRTDKISQAVGGILSKAQIRKGVAGLATSGVRGLDGKALSDDNAALMLKGVTQLGRVGGFDSTEALSRLQNAVSTGSTAGLDKILPGFDADLAVRKYMDDTGMEKDEIESTPGLQQSIVTQAIIDAIKVGFKNTPEASRASGDSYDRLAAAAMDAKDGLIETIGASQEFKSAVEAMTKALQDARPGLENAAKGVAGFLGSEGGLGVAGGLGMAAVGAKAGFAVGGPLGAFFGAVPGAGVAAYGAGQMLADQAQKAIYNANGATARGERFAEPEGFDQAAYDKEQYDFQQKLAGMSESEYETFKNGPEMKALKARNDEQSKDLMMGSSEKASMALDALTGKLLDAGEVMFKFMMKVNSGPVGWAYMARDVADNVGGS